MVHHKLVKDQKIFQQKKQKVKGVNDDNHNCWAVVVVVELRTPQPDYKMIAILIKVVRR